MDEDTGDRPDPGAAARLTGATTALRRLVGSLPVPAGCAATVERDGPAGCVRVRFQAPDHAYEILLEPADMVDPAAGVEARVRAAFEAWSARRARPPFAPDPAFAAFRAAPDAAAAVAALAAAVATLPVPPGCRLRGGPGPPGQEDHFLLVMRRPFSGRRRVLSPAYLADPACRAQMERSIRDAHAAWVAAPWTGDDAAWLAGHRAAGDGPA